MNHKRMMFSGISILCGSILIGFLGIIWGITDSFRALGNETAGIGNIGSSIEKALIFNVLAILGFILGLILIIYSVFKNRVNKNMPNK